MKIIIVSKHEWINGSPINLLDFQDYLIRMAHDVVFYCVHPWQVKKMLDLSQRKYKIGNIKKISDVILHRNENVVTDFMSLINIKEPIVCNKLIVMDNAELFYHLNGITNFFYKQDICDIEKILDKHMYSDIEFLMPPCNYKQFIKRYPNLKASIFFKKINVDALLTIPIKDNKRWYVRLERDGNEPKEVLNYLKSKSVDGLTWGNLNGIFNYHGYIYRRRVDRNCVEQLGRNIFEFIILGKKIHYIDHPLSNKDGLFDYWNHYGKGDKEIIRMMMSEDYKYKPWLS